jgi:hypothetical protein
VARNNQRGRNNNNPEGRNQYSNGWMDTAKDKPFTTAAAAAAAVGAGVFLWSRRNQISDQINSLSGQLYDWADEMRAEGSNRELAMTEGPNESSAIEASRATTSRRGTGNKSRATGSRKAGASTSRGMSATGGGNASLGAHSGTGTAGTTGTGPRA